MKSYIVIDLVQPDTSLLQDSEEENFFYTAYIFHSICAKGSQCFLEKKKKVTILYQSFGAWARWKQISEPCLGEYLQHRFIEWRLMGKKI